MQCSVCVVVIEWYCNDAVGDNVSAEHYEQTEMLQSMYLW